MKIKFRKNLTKINGSYSTQREEVRKFMHDNMELHHEAYCHNMNFYRLCCNNMLIHVYDCYEVEEN